LPAANQHLFTAPTQRPLSEGPAGDGCDGRHGHRPSPVAIAFVLAGLQRW
jgi:hypothetical protein